MTELNATPEPTSAQTTVDDEAATLLALPAHCPNTGTDQCDSGEGCPAC